jgi:quercetin dioxygenase-like cupin family protein
MSRYYPEPHEQGRHTIFPGVTIRTAAGQGMSLSLADLEAGSVVEEHAHPHEQVGMIVKGRVVFTIGGEERTLGPGDFYRIPGGVRHKVVVLGEPAQALDIFAPVREEYR